MKTVFDIDPTKETTKQMVRAKAAGIVRYESYEREVFVLGSFK